jgi:hypothetical protein
LPIADQLFTIAINASTAMIVVIASNVCRLRTFSPFIIFFFLTRILISWCGEDMFTLKHKALLLQLKYNVD